MQTCVWEVEIGSLFWNVLEFLTYPPSDSHFSLWNLPYIQTDELMNAYTHHSTFLKC